ncbi:LysR family transcriptional regulator [Lactiplantibacillus paraplantarum]|uniref:LysR family transcriptional regulator n=1 Tax=Lactiplantibacillus paraplantarum TaxID=60520 RepID=UPI0023AA8062|nr:LysR family transcriptional regulator [Lactiplantibacillus paraplantarum]WEE35248.1 LysR family transcriptional regulator [Lactiplantibacillus paraplantarum]
MNIKDLQYYVSLTQLKNFSLVAAQFHVSQPTISAAVRRLETELKTQLLIRANPHLPVALTTTGIQVQRHASQILLEHQLMCQEVAHTTTDQLVIGMPPIIEINYFPRIASQLPQALFSQIQPISQGSLAALKGLKNGQLDLAVLAYLNEFTDTTIQLTTFDTQSFSIVVPTDDPLATHSQLQFRSLRHQRFVALKDNFVHRQAFRQLSHQNHVRPTIVFESNEIGSILNMVRQHVGIALLSNAVQLPAGLHRLPLTDAQAPTFNVGVAYRHSMTFSPTQADLIQRLTAAFQSVDWHAY